MCHGADCRLAGESQEDYGNESTAGIFEPLPKGLPPPKEENEIKKGIEPEPGHEERVSRSAEGVWDGENEGIEYGSCACTDRSSFGKRESMSFDDAPRSLAVEERVGLRHGHAAVRGGKHPGKIIPCNLNESDAEHEDHELFSIFED